MYTGVSPKSTSDDGGTEYSTASATCLYGACTGVVRSAVIRKNPVRLIDDLRKELTDSDRMVVNDVGVRTMLLRNYREGLRTSAWGWIDDAIAFSNPWGFEPAEITGPVMLWHGEKDVFSPVGHSRWLAGRIPNSTVVVDPAAAHFDALHALPRVLNWLLESASG
ncbi:hypothetical protein FHX80_11555 [Streptomyces brevispora]|uniref:Alpha/beta hydrolase family protein n=1 Tax=Streptomyces brevispora TaxID=887462 RepID=A0A561US27_9ACTN|nr:hypothetical protein FHX80_11555 [Streptomyces brevispora]